MIDSRLKEAATAGDIDRFYELLGADAFILENVEKIPFIDTPLHLAVENGHTCFVEEITNLMPSFCLKLNQRGFSPLHLASSFGKLEIVKVLLKDECRLKTLMEAKNVDGLCTLQGKEKMTPLHCAAIAGCIDVLKELLSNCPKSIIALTVKKETALHLAARFDRVEALGELARWKDQDGNTVLHLATSTGQYEVVKAILVDSCHRVREAVQVDATNNAGRTALDLVPSEPDWEPMRTIIQSNSRARNGQDTESQQVTTPRRSVMKWLPKSSKTKHLLRYLSLKVDKDTPPDTRNALLVVVVLIVTATFQTGLNPPGGYWTNTQSEDESNHGGDFPHNAGDPIWATYALRTYNAVMFFNFAGFVLSLILSYNITQGYPLRFPLLLALVLMLLTYSWSTPIFYKYTANGAAGNGAAGDYYSLTPANLMLWVPVILIVIIWATTASWMAKFWRKLMRLTGRESDRESHD